MKTDKKSEMPRRVNVESLFAALYKNGSAKLSDHFYPEEEE